MQILHVDDDEQSRRVVAQVIESLLGHQVVLFDDPNEALKRFLKTPFPIVITDIRMPGLNGLELLQRIKQFPSGTETDVILITGFADVETAVAALRQGASDYLCKPLKAAELLDVINRLVTQRSLKEFEAPAKSGMVGSAAEPVSRAPGVEPSVVTLPDGSTLGIFSLTMRALTAMALRFHEDRSVPVLIEGETGTGKDLFAKLVHYGREGSDRPFISVNCSAITPTLFDSELFGYTAGAFTGASRSGAKGMLEAAEGGSIFLDEISEIPLELQPKLLRALQEKAIYRVGSTRRIPLDFRLITVTNRNLEQMIEAGRFRQDLFYRLNVGRLVVPPLRKQPGAIAPLAQMFLKEAAERKERRFRGIQPEAIRILEAHSWPGNVRELKNLIENVVLLYDDLELRPEHLGNLHLQSPGRKRDEFDVAYPIALRLPQEGFNLDALNREIVKQALKRFNGNQTKAAQYLGLSRYALRSRLKKLDEQT